MSQSADELLAEIRKRYPENLGQFLESPAFTHARETMLLHRLCYDAYVAAACRGYALEVYKSPIDHDGYDLIFDDRSTIRKLQVKSVREGSSKTTWEVHRSLLLPRPTLGSKLMVVHLDFLRTGSEGGVVIQEFWSRDRPDQIELEALDARERTIDDTQRRTLRLLQGVDGNDPAYQKRLDQVRTLEAERHEIRVRRTSEATVDLRYLYTDLLLLLALRFVPHNRASSALPIDEFLFTRLLGNGGGHEQMSFPRSMFVTAKSPEALLALAGLLTRDSSSWRMNVLQVIEVDSLPPPVRAEKAAFRQALVSVIQQALSVLCLEVCAPEQPC